MKNFETKRSFRSTNESISMLKQYCVQALMPLSDDCEIWNFVDFEFQSLENLIF